MTKELKLLSALYGCIVFALLLLQHFYKLPHPEWGLLTLPLIFSPTRKNFFHKSIYRVSATFFGAFLLFALSGVTNRYLYYFCLVCLIMLISHLSIKYKKYFYFFFIINVTIGIFGIGNFHSADSQSVLPIIEDRIFETLLSCALILIPLGIFLKLNKKFAFTNQLPHGIEEPTHFQLFLRALITYLGYILLYILAGTRALQGAGVMLTILFASTTLYKNPVPMVYAKIKIILFSAVIVFLLKVVSPYLDLPFYINFLFISLTYGYLMYLSFKHIKHEFFFKMIMVVGPVLYSITPPPLVNPTAFCTVLGVFLIGILFIYVGHQISIRVHHKITNKENI
ncbi:FUSC family protein [Flammeovirga kamogawensis]|uniref:FUSC family protein n=1 Tax=Flammeovirga kamogawensis TaxID=373891 RepID=A0ABX8H2H9_9BACT|nr:FUSC family protein [Flammeovirga kamogawensis]MBB6463610.1 hypothetical protein [Flammeovirga kamogawensis]QWG09833.1 FUSC family protein [Flammeovirga kamogawensis]TRX65341.1 FUSC family protein [Flammeovirga kamogawensis]